MDWFLVVVVESTVVSFFVEFVDAFSLVDSVLVSLFGMADHANLVILVNEVALRLGLAGSGGGGDLV